MSLKIQIISFKATHSKT